MSDAASSAHGTKADVSELIGLVKAYAIEQTVGPLKKAARTLAFGSAAAVTLGIAAVLSLVALLRALQTETGTVFSGEWNWAPYLLTAAAGILFLGLAAALVLRGRSQL